jgi:hypothetical protein
VVTANDIEFGGSVTLTLTAGDVLALRAGYGQPRLYELDPSEPDCTVSLPDARRLRPGVAHFVVLNADNTDSFDILLNDGATTLTTVQTGKLAILHLQANATANGTWVVETRDSFAKGSLLGTNRYPVTLIFNENVDRPNLSYLAQQRGWDGVSPVAMVVTVNSTGIVYNADQTGGTATPEASLRFEGFPANSTFLLVNFGLIAGRGGRGGNGGPFAVTKTSGQPGGSAVSTDANLTLANFGTIQGGGGGGVGTTGGSGGGGAGYAPGLGGNIFGAGSQYQGFTGSQNIGGAGVGDPGTTGSGDGGARGAAGTSNLTNQPSLTGGAKGWAILRIGTPTITTINAGTQFGGTS